MSAVGDEPVRPEVAVGGVAVSNGRLLLVQRGRGVAVGRWALPGGRLEPGESIAEGIAREFLEETHLKVQVGALCGVAERRGIGYHYVICNHWVQVADPAQARAADDALAVIWADTRDLQRLPTVPLLVEWLAEHRVLDAMR